MIRYNNLFALLSMKGMKKTDLLEVISSPTLAKLSKNQNVNSEIIDKLCIFLECQPNDIMQSYKIVKFTDEQGNEHTQEILANQTQIDVIWSMLKNNSIVDEVLQNYKNAVKTEADKKAMDLTEQLFKKTFNQE